MGWDVSVYYHGAGRKVILVYPDEGGNLPSKWAALDEAQRIADGDPDSIIAVVEEFVNVKRKLGR